MLSINKAVQGDQEAIVVGIGNHNSVSLKLYVKSYNSFYLFLLIRLRPNGTSLLVPPHDVYVSTPSVGDIVTFAYESGPKKDNSLNPKIYRIRYDIKWDEVLYNFHRDKRYLNGMRLLYCYKTFVIYILQMYLTQRNLL